MKPRFPLFLLLVVTLLWCLAYTLMTQRFPLLGFASPEEHLSAFSRAIAAGICFVVGLTILAPLAAGYLLWSLRRMTNFLVDSA